MGVPAAVGMGDGGANTFEARSRGDATDLECTAIMLIGGGAVDRPEGSIRSGTEVPSEAQERLAARVNEAPSLYLRSAEAARRGALL